MELRVVNGVAVETSGRLFRMERYFWLAALGLVAALCGLAPGMVRQAVAAQPMYVLGQLSVSSFGNDTTTGASAPFYSNNYVGLPFGQHCNPVFGTGMTACYATSAKAHAGSPLAGTGIISVSASPGGPIDLPASLLKAKLGTLPSVFDVSNFAKRPVNGVPGGSFSYYPPYIYSYTYADLKNAAGHFFSGGGPGNFAIAVPATPLGGNAGAMSTTQTGAKFGGTMRMLGSLKVHSAVSYPPTTMGASDLLIGTHDWLLDWVGNGSVTASGAVAVRSTMTTQTSKHNGLGQTKTVYLTAKALPWTTGSATVTATRGPFFSKMARAGYDNRTAAGAGNVQMVSPMLTHWRTPGGGSDYETASIGKLRLTFAPEPSAALILGAGISLLGLLYRAGRQD